MTMREPSITPSITVTIGRHTRLYFAFVTTAPARPRLTVNGNTHAAAFSDDYDDQDTPLELSDGGDPVAQDGLRGIVLQAYLAREQEMAESTTRK
jgi:hypothetical protein